MAFVGDPFRHDIFVSYSQGDVRGDGRALLKQWSHGWMRELELELQAFADLGAEIKVFLDQNPRPDQGVDTMGPLTEGLKDEVSASAILAVLMTPQYIGSKWCTREREWWVEGQRKLELPHDKRIAVARVWPTESTAWPKEFVDSEGPQYLGHTFFDGSRADIRPQPYGWPLVDGTTTGPFRDALLDYVGRIRMRLLELKRELDQRRERVAERERLKAPKGQAIYLHGRTAHAPVWERVHRELGDDGYAVFPLQPEPVESDPRKIRETQNERVATMSGCDAVLLLGTDDVSALTSDLMVIGRLDRHLAIARSSRSLPCGVVDTSGVGLQKPDWSRNAKKLGMEWFDASIPPPWIPRVRTWLKEAAP